MKTYMTTFAATAAAFLATPALAHGGHTELVDGHTHTLLDLALISAGPAALVLVGVALAVHWVARRND